MVEHLVLLREHKDQSPQVRDEPCVDGLVATIGRHENLRHCRKQTLQRVLLKVFGESVFIDIDDLIC